MNLRHYYIANSRPKVRVGGGPGSRLSEVPLRRQARTREVRPAPEQVGERQLAVRTIEHVGFVDLDPRQVAALLAQRIAGAGELLFMHHQRLARLGPLLAGYDLVRLHAILLVYSATNFSSTSKNVLQPRL